MDKDTYKDIRRALKDRVSWENRQDTWYRMRHSGIRRSFKPYDGAPDQHYPLVDTVIEKLKPFYIQQPYAQDRFATFVSKKSASRELTVCAEQFFDYQLKQKSNFETSLMIGTDTHLTYGVCPIKIYWDEAKNQLAFDPIDPLYVIVPTWTEDLQGADWLVHVKRLSKSQYRNDKHYKQSDGMTDRISGRGSGENIGSFQKEQTVYQREGLTYTPDKQQILIWECYTKQSDGTWLIETISPVLGVDEPLRKPFKMPYAHGKLPFVALRLDMSEKGWYSSRGIAEILLPHELALNKDWNAKLQYLDFFGQPNFKNNSLQPFNSLDFKNAPGAILPPGIEPVAPQSAPIDFVSEMQFIRALAEDRIKVPDLSASEHLQGPSSSTGKPTATQVNAIVGLSSQSNDMRARFYRIQLSEVYTQAWQLITEFAKDEVQYIADSATQELPPDALQDIYTIAPSGSADSWNTALRQTKAMAIYQTLLGKPNVQQDELLKFLLESGSDSTLVKRLYQDTGVEQQDQSQIQAQETGLMKDGFLPQVKPAHDHKVHLSAIDGWTKQKAQSGEPISPSTASLLVQHAGQHARAIVANKDKQGRMAMKQMEPTLHLLQNIAASGAQQQGAMPPQAAPSPGSNGAQAPEGVRESIAINYKDAPPDIQRQMEQKAGFQPSGSGIPTSALVANAQKAGNGAQVAPGQPSAPNAPTRPTLAKRPLPIPPTRPPLPPTPIVHVAAPIVHVPPAVVHVPPQPPQPAPIVHIHHPKKSKVTFNRDKSGHIQSGIVEHLE